MTEDELLGNVIEMAHLFGWKVAHFRAAKTERGWRTAVQGDGKGFPDLVLVRGDRLYFVELKSDSGRLTSEQDAWLLALEGVASTDVWRPSDWTSGKIEAWLR